MHVSRRVFTTLSLGAIAGAALGPASKLLARGADEASPMLFDWKETTGGAKVAFGQGGNALLVMSRGQSLLVDCKNPGLGDTLRRECGTFGSPLAMVVNSHHHRDHVGGNVSFTSHLPLLAHVNAKPRIQNQVEGMLGSVAGLLRQLEASEKPVPQKAMDEVRAFSNAIEHLEASEFVPNRLVEGELHTEKLGELEVHLYHFGAGHTDNDLVVFFPSLNLMHTGDLLFHKLHPFMDRPAGATSVGWQGSLKRMFDLCDENTVVIPGHGEITDRGALQGQIEYFDALRKAVRHAKDVESMTKEEVMKLKPGAVEGYGFEQMLPRALGVMYDELEAG